MDSDFDLLPAIDLRDGRVVRLQRGDFARETAFSTDPTAVALGFADAGARWLHVVDLDGARTGQPVHAAVIEAIVGALGDRLSVEVAGGLRTEDDVTAILRSGAARAVLGTAALRDPTLVGRLVARHGSHRIAAAIDVRDGLAVGEAWRAGTAGVPSEAALAALAAQGVELFEVTAIERDGLLEGPDLALLGRLVGLGQGSVIASGGVSGSDDLVAVRDLGCRGVIVGRALYEGRLDLRRALAWAASVVGGGPGPE